MAEVKGTPQNTASDTSKQQGTPNGMGRVYYTRLSIAPYSRPIPFDDAKWNPYATFSLPLPLEMADVTASGYSTMDMGFIGDLTNGSYVGGAASALLRESGNLAVEAGLSIPSVFQASQFPRLQPGQTPTWWELFKPQLTQTLTRQINPAQLTTAFEQALGVAPNPNPTVKYIGPVLRDFTLTWTFAPKSKDQSDGLAEFIRVVKAAALPNNFFNQSASILEYPDMVQLNFFPWDEGNGTSRWGWSDNSIIRYKKCMIGSVSVFYNPSNVPAFYARTNAPVATHVSINFKEIEYMFATDWNTKYSVPVVSEKSLNELGDTGASIRQVFTRPPPPVQAPIPRFSDLLQSDP